MSRANVQTKLPLNQWASILGLNLYELAQQRAVKVKTGGCDSVFYQYNWQKGTLGRDDIARTIAEAERLVEDIIGYPIAPTPITEQLPLTLNALNNRWGNPFYNAEGRPRGIMTRQQRVVTPGVLKRELIIADQNLTLEDADADGIFEGFVLTFNASGWQGKEGEIALYMIAGDRLNSPLDEQWRLRPLRVTATANDVTIRGHISLMTLPRLQEAYAPEEVAIPAPNQASANKVILKADVYRVYYDTTATAEGSTHGSAIFEPYPGCGDGCVESYAPICLGEVDKQMGMLNVKLLGGVACPEGYTTRLKINYIAGMPLVNGMVEPNLARAVTYLSAALIPQEMCGCDSYNQIFKDWHKTPPTSGEGARPLTDAELQCPWGVSKGAVAAWGQIQHWRQIRPALA